MYYFIKAMTTAHKLSKIHKSLLNRIWRYEKYGYGSIYIEKLLSYAQKYRWVLSALHRVKPRIFNRTNIVNVATECMLLQKAYLTTINKINKEDSDSNNLEKCWLMLEEAKYYRTCREVMLALLQ